MNHKPSMLQRLFIPSVFDLIVMITFTTMVLADPVIKCFDVFWHLRTGDLLLDGVFPVSDIFSHTAYGKPWILHEWGSQVIFSLVYRFMGFPGLIVLKSLVFSLMYGLMFNLMQKKKINIFISLIFTLILFFGTAGSWTVRPHIFTNFFLVILFWIYVDFKAHESKKILWTLPLLFVFWINFHGGFIIGFVFLAVCIAAEITACFFKLGNERETCISHARQLVGWSLVSFAACLLNPNTYKGLLYPLMYLGDQMDSKSIQEWAAPTMETDVEFYGFIMLIILGLAFSHKRCRLYEILLIMVFASLAFSAKRHISVFSIMVIPVMAVVWQENIVSLFSRLQAVTQKSVKKYLMLASKYFVSRSDGFGYMEKHLRCHLPPLVIIAAMTILSLMAPERFSIRLKENIYPVEIVEYMKSKDISGNIFNQYEWGGYILWTLPDVKVFIDGRMDVYKREVSEPYQIIVDMEEGWRELVEKYDVRHILVDKKKNISRFLLQNSDEWLLEKESHIAYLFSKKKIVQMICDQSGLIDRNL